jgi:glycosyltransferase involved in cell wall biosynthesis
LYQPQYIGGEEGKIFGKVFILLFLGLLVPFISVIITAINRREFLLEAVNSALNQTLPRNEYEIIVVKNFSEYDDILKNLNVKTVFSNEVNQGVHIVNALPYVEGEVVCFLDDDDIWVPWRLEKVKEAFREESLGYYHNAFLAFRQGENTSELINKLKENDKEFIRNRYTNLSPINSSSTCIKKDILVKYVPQLKKVMRFIDTFYYYFALLKNCKIKFDPAILTLYRLHYNNSHTIKEKSFQDWLKKKITFHSNRYELILELINSYKSEGISDTAVKVLLTDALSDKITVTRLSKDGPYKATFRDFLKYISLNYKNLKGILLASLIFMPTPIQLYVARRWYEKEQKAP